MHTQENGSSRCVALLLGIIVFALAGFAFALADPPGRVARLGYVTGPVGFSPAGEDYWVEARLNRPLVTGDRLWADAGARVELQIGAAAIRLGEATSVTLLDLDDRVVQLHLAQGTLNLRVRRLDQDQVVEVDTPNLAYLIRRPGQYRISVDADSDSTQVMTRSGRAEVYGDGTSYVVDAGRSYRFYGTGLRDYETLALPGFDEFDHWTQDRDRSYDNSISARYVSRDVIGYEDLDAYGSWRAVPEYGNVWMPTRVNADWSPYRDGHWAWVEPWGWTWVDDAPWGFTVSHYGRWVNIRGSWGWIPGPIAARAVYAPALVLFVGGANFQIPIASGRVGAVGWFPLGPRDVYHPAYPVSHAYFTNVNVSNTAISNTTITNVYNKRTVTNITYVNQQVAGAVVTVPRTAFVQSQPVARAALRVSHDAVVRAPVHSVAEIAPMPVSVRGAAPQGAKPPEQVLARRVVAKSVPPTVPVGFAAKERGLATNPGKPLAASDLETLRRITPLPRPKVEVVAPTRAANPVAAPPLKRARSDQRGKPAEAPVAATSERPAPAAAAPPEQRGKSEQRGKPAEAPVAAPSERPAAAAAAPPEQRGKSEQRGKPAEAPVAATSERPAPAAAAPPEQRGKSEQRGRPGAPPAVKGPTPPVPPAATPPERPGEAEQTDREPKAKAAKSENKKTDEELRRDEEEKRRQLQHAGSRGELTK